MILIAKLAEATHSTGWAGAVSLMIAALTCTTVNAGDRVPLHGRIVATQSLPLAKVRVSAAYVHFHSEITDGDTKAISQNRPLAISIDEQGKFQIDREQRPMLIYCETEDGSLAGVAQVDADMTEMEVALRPVTRVHGRLVDHQTGNPLPGQRLTTGIHFRSLRHDIVQTNFFGKGTVTTDENGRFEISGLVDGQKYRLTGLKINKRDGGGVGLSLHSLGTFVADSNDGQDIGDVCQSRHYFSSDALPADRVGEAIQLAAPSKQHVLVVFSSAGDHVFRLFDNLRFQDDSLREVLDGFKVVVIDTAGEHAADAAALAERLGLSLPEGNQGSCFCFLDESGDVLERLFVAATERQAFPREKLFDVALKHSPALPDVDALFAAALKQASDEGKQILLQETGPHCVPCELMSRFMESTRQYWSDDFVWLTLDQRWPGTTELMDRLRDHKEPTSIPWYAVLDADGQVRFTSIDQAGENRGFPGSDQSKSHFRKMLEGHAPQMTETSIDAMLDTLGTR